MPACPGRTANSLATGSVVLTVPWALQAGTAGFGVSGVTQSGTATYTITVSSGNIAAIAPLLESLLDVADNLSRGGNAIAVVT
jgi:hypothetical protein